MKLSACCQLIYLRYSVFLTCILVLCSATLPAFGQRNARNAIYLEAASQGPVYSLNYDRIVREGEKLAYSLRAGFSVEKNALSFPVGFNFITGKHDHHGEFGLTIIPYFHYYEDHPTANYTDKADKYILCKSGSRIQVSTTWPVYFFKGCHRTISFARSARQVTFGIWIQNFIFLDLWQPELVFNYWLENIKVKKVANFLKVGNLSCKPFTRRFSKTYAFRLMQFRSSNANSSRFTKFSSPFRNHTRGS